MWAIRDKFVQHSFEDLALVEGFALQVITSPAQILVDQRLRLSRVSIQFFPIVGVVIDLPVL